MHSARRSIDDSDVLSTLERCYRLIQESTKSGNGSVENGSRKLLPNSVPGSASSLRTSAKAYLARFLKRNTFDKIKTRQTRVDHNLFDVIWPAMKKRNSMQTNGELDYDMDAGIIAPDFDVFVVFQEFLVPVIKDLHCIDVHSDFSPQPPTQYFPFVNVPTAISKDTSEVGEQTNAEVIYVNLDKTGKYINGCCVECSRNLEQFELPLNLNLGSLEQVERIITGKLLSHDFSKIIDEKDLGVYYTMNEVLENSSEIRTVLAANGLLIPLLNSSDPYQRAESLAINGRYWPYGRGVYVSTNCDFVVWINVQEHFRVICCTSTNAPGNIGRPYTKIGKAIMYLSEQIEFRNSYFLGHLASRPSFLGTSLRLTFIMDLPHLMKEPDNLQHLCNVRGLRMATHFKTSSIRVSNMQSLSVSEWRIFQDFCTAVANVLQLEKDLSIDSSNNIAAMLINIFKRKRNSFEAEKN